MKVKLIQHPSKGGLSLADFEIYPFITRDALSYLNISAPYSLKYFVDNNTKIFTKEEIQLIHELVDSEDLSNQIMALSIIESK